MSNTITKKYITGEPVSGGRSRSCFGIDKLMDQRFFGVTSHCADGAPQPDPRIKLFRRNEQSKMMRMVVDAATAVGLSKGDGLKEWYHSLVPTCTERCTKMVSDLIGDTANGYIEYNETNKAIIVRAYLDAKAYIHGLVAVYSEDKKHWTTWRNHQPELFGDTKPSRQTIPPGLRAKVMKRDRDACLGIQRCMICKTSNAGDQWHIDHIISCHAGGPTEEWNLHTTCSHCNLGKSSSSYPEFLTHGIPDQWKELVENIKQNTKTI